VSSLTNKQTKKLKTREFEEKKIDRSAFGKGKTVKIREKLEKLEKKYLQKKQEGASFYHSGLRPPLKKTSPLLFYRKYLGFFHPARKGKSGILSFVSNLNERM